MARSKDWTKRTEAGKYCKGFDCQPSEDSTSLGGCVVHLPCCDCCDDRRTLVWSLEQPTSWATARKPAVMLLGWPSKMQDHAIHVRSNPGFSMCQSKKVDFTSKGLIFSNAPPKSSISINFNVFLGGEKYQKYQGFWLLRPWYRCFRGSYATFALL